MALPKSDQRKRLVLGSFGGGGHRWIPALNHSSIPLWSDLRSGDWLVRPGPKGRKPREVSTASLFHRHNMLMVAPASWFWDRKLILLVLAKTRLITDCM